MGGPRLTGLSGQPNLISGRPFLVMRFCHPMRPRPAQQIPPNPAARTAPICPSERASATTTDDWHSAHDAARPRRQSPPAVASLQQSEPLPHPANAHGRRLHPSPPPIKMISIGARIENLPPSRHKRLQSQIKAPDQRRGQISAHAKSRCGTAVWPDAYCQISLRPA